MRTAIYIHIHFNINTVWLFRRPWLGNTVFLVIWHSRVLLFHFSLCCNMPVMEEMVTGKSDHLPSWEEAVRCSNRSHPNTFSLFPPFLRTLRISSSLLYHLTFRPARAALVVTVRPTDCLCGCWMCCPTQLTWHWLCRGSAHFTDLTVLLLLFPLLQCMLLGAGCFLCKLCCTGVDMSKLEC